MYGGWCASVSCTSEPSEPPKKVANLSDKHDRNTGSRHFGSQPPADTPRLRSEVSSRKESKGAQEWKFNRFLRPKHALLIGGNDRVDDASHDPSESAREETHGRTHCTYGKTNSSGFRTKHVPLLATMIVLTMPR